MNELEEYAPPSHAQKAFNEVWRRFVIEKHLPGIDYAKTRCSWKGTDENRCAIGWLIPDDMLSEIKPGMQQSVKGIVRGKNSIAMYFKKHYNINFLRDLETLHDHGVQTIGHLVNKAKYKARVAESVGKFHTSVKLQLIEVARKWSLTIPGKE